MRQMQVRGWVQRLHSNDSAANVPMQVSQDENLDEDTAEPIISYPEEEDWEKLDGPAQK